MNGAKIQIEMSNLPNENRGIAAEDAPYSFQWMRNKNLHILNLKP